MDTWEAVDSSATNRPLSEMHTTLPNPNSSPLSLTEEARPFPPAARTLHPRLPPVAHLLDYEEHVNVAYVHSVPSGPGNSFIPRTLPENPSKPNSFQSIVPAYEMPEWRSHDLPHRAGRSMAQRFVSSSQVIPNGMQLNVQSPFPGVNIPPPLAIYQAVPTPDVRSVNRTDASAVSTPSPEVVETASELQVLQFPAVENLPYAEDPDLTVSESE